VNQKPLKKNEKKTREEEKDDDDVVDFVVDSEQKQVNG
jgi:hypothetical protein